MSNAYTLKESVERRADLYRQEASVLRRRGAISRAELLEGVAEELEELAHDHAPDWWTLSEVQAVRGWSERWLRERAREFANRGGPGHPLARKDNSGRWEFHTLALEEIPTSPSHDVEEVGLDDATVADLALR